jgi:three-Cys-motif partner protein
MTLVLIEKDAANVNLLEKHLGELEPFPSHLNVHVFAADSKTLVPDILDQTRELAPSFFMIDPYGHPMTVPTINQILLRPRTEAFINLMWFRINMDLGNPVMHILVDQLFGNGSWRDQPFMREVGIAREDGFLSYFCSCLKAKFVLPFRIGFDKEDKVPGQRTKYYLLHASNHARAPLLMKEVMWPLGDEDGTFDFSGESQGVLISRVPKHEELGEILLCEFKGRRIEFEKIREMTWKLPFVGKHYRAAIKQLRVEGLAKVTPVTSKKTGVKGRDLVEFLPQV